MGSPPQVHPPDKWITSASNFRRYRPEVLWIATAAAASLSLPPSEDPGDWEAAAEMAGLELVQTSATVEIQGDPWQICAAEQCQRVAEPAGPGEREDLVYLAAGLARQLEFAQRREAEAKAQASSRPSPPKPPAELPPVVDVEPEPEPEPEPTPAVEVQAPPPPEPAAQPPATPDEEEPVVALEAPAPEPSPARTWRPSLQLGPLVGVALDRGPTAGLEARLLASSDTWNLGGALRAHSPATLSALAGGTEQVSVLAAHAERDLGRLRLHGQLGLGLHVWRDQGSLVDLRPIPQARLGSAVDLQLGRWGLQPMLGVQRALVSTEIHTVSEVLILSPWQADLGLVLAY